MSSAVIEEKVEQGSADVLLAERTLEIIRVIEMSNHLLKARFNDNPNLWMEAMFHVLKLRNSEYLWEERYTQSETQLLCQKVHDNLTRMYSKMEAYKQNNEECDMKTRSDFLSNSNSLVKLFRKYTNLLVKTENSTVDDGAVVSEMKLILQNITNFISRYERENVRNPEKNGISRGEESSVAPCKAASIGMKHTDDSNVTYSNPNNKEQVVVQNGEKDRNFFPNLNPLLSTLNKKAVPKKANVCASSSATQLLDKSSVPKSSQKLSESDRSRSVDFLNKSTSHLPTSNSFKKQLIPSLGEKCDAIIILNDHEFYCKICECPISAWQNVISHAGGKQHMGNLGIKKGKSGKKSADGSPNAVNQAKSELLSRSTSNDRGVLQISTVTIPIQHLEI